MLYRWDASSHLPGKAGSIATNLVSQIADLTSELGTVYKGGNSSTDESLKLAATNLSADWNDQTFTDAMKRVRTNLQIRKNSITHSLPAGVSANSPYTPQSEAAPNVPAARAGGSPPAGATHAVIVGGKIVGYTSDGKTMTPVPQ